jgi:hypothetical protein
MSDGDSLASSIYGYVYENGRRYHAYREGNYLLPNDAEEQDRLDLSHHIFRLQLGGALHFAPIDRNLKRVLDIGTGMNSRKSFVRCTAITSSFVASNVEKKHTFHASRDFFMRSWK